MTTLHVYPLDDLHPHQIEGNGENCGCRPKIEWEGFSRLVIHNSYDGRELLEQKYQEIEQ